MPKITLTIIEFANQKFTESLLVVQSATPYSMLYLSIWVSMSHFAIVIAQTINGLYAGGCTGKCY